jgi:hypothetical protein
MSKTAIVTGRARCIPRHGTHPGADLEDHYSSAVHGVVAGSDALLKLPVTSVPSPPTRLASWARQSHLSGRLRSLSCRLFVRRRTHQFHVSIARRANEFNYAMECGAHCLRGGADRCQGIERPTGVFEVPAATGAGK